MLLYCVTLVRIQCYVLVLWLLDMAHIVRASPELPQGQGAHSTWHSGHSENEPSALPADRPVQTPRIGSKSTAVCVGKREKNTQKD